jgi:hypothetical protein
MAKILAVLGGVIAIIAVVLPFVDATMGWWQFTLSSLLGDTTHFYNSLGQ